MSLVFIYQVIWYNSAAEILNIFVNVIQWMVMSAMLRSSRLKHGAQKLRNVCNSYHGKGNCDRKYRDIK